MRYVVTIEQPDRDRGQINRIKQTCPDFEYALRILEVLLDPRVESDELTCSIKIAPEQGNA